MRICIVCPAPPGSPTGNRVTALRWARMLRSLGHRATIVSHYAGKPYDLLVALHARRSFDAVRTFSRRHPDRPLFVALTGTDLYGDLRRSRRAQRALALATRLIALQPLALRELPRHLRAKTRVLYQSAATTPRRRLRGRPRGAAFDVCVVAHLRPVKDPFRAAQAVRRLPVASRIRVLHAGRALTPAMAQRARAEMQRNPRYRWLGERTSRQVRTLLGRSKLLVLSSRMEGGANVISEALRASLPVVASDIPGSCGLLGIRYPALFPVGDTTRLASLLRRAETDQRFHGRLVAAGRRRARLFTPERERRSWAELLREIGVTGRRRRSRS